MDEITGLQFGIQENVMPVFGYNSFTYDRAPRGQRFVQGSFSIAFKEAGYIYRILEHVAQMKTSARPGLNYAVQGSKKPEWVAGINETIEGLMKRAGKSVEGEMAEYESRIWGDPTKPGVRPEQDTYFYGSEAQKYLKAEGFDIYINYGEMPHAASQNKGVVASAYNFHATVKAIRGVQLTGVQQIIGPTGDPIGEQYSFIAKDLD